MKIIHQTEVNEKNEKDNAQELKKLVEYILRHHEELEKAFFNKMKMQVLSRLINGVT